MCSCLSIIHAILINGCKFEDDLSEGDHAVLDQFRVHTDGFLGGIDGEEGVTALGVVDQFLTIRSKKSGHSTEHLERIMRGHGEDGVKSVLHCVKNHSISRMIPLASPSPIP